MRAEIASAERKRNLSQSTQLSKNFTGPINVRKKCNFHPNWLKFSGMKEYLKILLLTKYRDIRTKIGGFMESLLKLLYTHPESAILIQISRNLVSSGILRYSFIPENFSQFG